MQRTLAAVTSRLAHATSIVRTRIEGDERLERHGITADEFEKRQRNAVDALDKAARALEDLFE